MQYPTCGKRPYETAVVRKRQLSSDLARLTLLGPFCPPGLLRVKLSDCRSTNLVTLLLGFCGRSC